MQSRGESDVLSVAIPPFNEAFPRLAVPLKNCTLPVGLEPLTVAVNVTD